MNNTSEDLSNSFLSFVSEYKVLIVIALLAGIGGILGYNLYLDSKANQNSEAADVFAQLSSNYGPKTITMSINPIVIPSEMLII